jgi:hypothetical protein
MFPGPVAANLGPQHSTTRQSARERRSGLAVRNPGYGPGVLLPQGTPRHEEKLLRLLDQGPERDVELAGRSDLFHRVRFRRRPPGVALHHDLHPLRQTGLDLRVPNRRQQRHELLGSQLPLRRPELSRGRQHTHHPRHIFVRLQLYSRRFGSVVRLPTLGQ